MHGVGAGCAGPVLWQSSAARTTCAMLAIGNGMVGARRIAGRNPQKNGAPWLKEVMSLSRLPAKNVKDRSSGAAADGATNAGEPSVGEGSDMMVKRKTVCDVCMTAVWSGVRQVRRQGRQDSRMRER